MAGSMPLMRACLSKPSGRPQELPPRAARPAGALAALGPFIRNVFIPPRQLPLPHWDGHLNGPRWPSQRSEIAVSGVLRSPSQRAEIDISKGWDRRLNGLRSAYQEGWHVHVRRLTSTCQGYRNHRCQRGCNRRVRRSAIDVSEGLQSTLQRVCNYHCRGSVITNYRGSVITNYRGSVIIIAGGL